jgi:ribosomal protein L29
MPKHNIDLVESIFEENQPLHSDLSTGGNETTNIPHATEVNEETRRIRKELLRVYLQQWIRASEKASTIKEPINNLLESNMKTVGNGTTKFPNKSELNEETRQLRKELLRASLKQWI